MRVTARQAGLVTGLGVIVLSVTAFAAASPLTAQNPRDAWVELLDAGQVDEARDHLVAFAGSLPPVEGTKVLRWVEAISLTEGEDQASVARAIVLVHRSQPGEATQLLTTRAPLAEPAAAPVLLAMAARFAEDSGDPITAASVREELVDTYPRHAMAPEALLDLARFRLDRGTELEATVTAVEDLIVDQPTHPLVPTARRLLERLRERVNG